MVQVQDGVSEEGSGEVSIAAVKKNGMVIFGNYLVIDHGNGEFSHLGHLKPGSVKVAIGDKVRAGQQIAQVPLSPVFCLPCEIADAIAIHYSTEKTVTDKAQIIDLLKKSIANAKSAATAITDADLDRKYKTFGGNEMTGRQVLTLILSHMHEHLGQLIAYARSNSVTPPWSK